jgi:hypothetical protein
LGKGCPEACCRIYFYLDEERHRFVVGHVGLFEESFRSVASLGR